MNNNNTIEFVPTVPGLIDLEELYPRPSVEFLPEWWRKAPFDSDMGQARFHPQHAFVRRCPAFPDLFSSGFIIPMWADTTIYYNSKTKEWRWRCGAAKSNYKINFFDENAFSNYGKYFFKGTKANAIFQLDSPWLIKAPPGISMFQLPIFYNDSNDYGVMSGTFDADLTAQQKIELAYFADDKEIFIKQGTPIAQYIPYKKINHNMTVREMEKEDFKHINKFTTRTNSLFKNWYSLNRRRNKG